MWKWILGSSIVIIFICIVQWGFSDGILYGIVFSAIWAWISYAVFGG